MNPNQILPHSPGPWCISQKDDIVATINGTLTDFISIEIPDYVAGGGIVLVHNKPWGVGMANARLIAAAPKLLAACRKAHAMDHNRPYPPEIIGELDQAIAEAEGRVMTA